MTGASKRIELLRWQFDLTWSLVELHLEQLTSDVLAWEPVSVRWAMRRDEGGRWVPDWDESELDPIPVPTAGWVAWHIGWWWSTALDHANGRAVRDRTEIGWSGDLDGVIGWLRDLRDQWLDVIAEWSDDDLDAPSSYPWGDGSGMTVAHTAAWLNAELMKNAAELGQLRLLRSASRSPGAPLSP